MSFTRILPLFVVLLTALNTHAQWLPLFDPDERVPAGSIQSATLVQWNVDEVKGEYKPTLILSRNTGTYDSAGMLIRMEDFHYQMKEPWRTTTYEYDSPGRKHLVTEYSISDEKKTLRHHRFWYDPQGAWYSDSIFAGTVRFAGRTICKTDSAGRVLEREDYDERNDLDHSLVYTYNASGQLSFYRLKNKWNLTSRECSYSFNEEGLVAEMDLKEYYEGEMEFHQTEQYEYNAAGQLIREIWTGTEGEQQITTYQLDAHGNWIREEMRDPEGELRALRERVLQYWQ